ncbi:HlyD family secretion protein [Agaribacter flavus]|uniref:HlyD family secretion protein n=1 Tax=Agaribacter flavus TaxID=1902781 RepID=A0ABV7FJV0_9ALTE
MSEQQIPDERVSYRQESVDNVFSQGQKPFFVQSPPKLSAYTLTFLLLLVFIVLSLFLIKLPVHMAAEGEVIAGKDYHQMVVNQDDQIVSNINVSEGEKVTEGQVLLLLENRNQRKLHADLQDIELQITTAKKHIEDANRFFQESKQNLEWQSLEQHKIIQQLRNTLVVEERVLQRYRKNVESGLIAATLVDEQVRALAQIEANLLKEESLVKSLALQGLHLEENFQREKHSQQAHIDRMQLARARLQDGLQILSPCNCVVDNIFTQEGLPVVSGQSVITLSNTREKSSLVLYIPAKNYRQIQVGHQIHVELSAYPVNKFGALLATVQSVSSSPVPGNMVNKHGQGLQATTYFVVKATIDKVPDNVSLVTGMAVGSDIVVDKTSLFDLLFGFDKKP